MPSKVKCICELSRVKDQGSKLATLKRKSEFCIKTSAVDKAIATKAAMAS